MSRSETSPLLPRDNGQHERIVVSWDGPDDTQNPANWTAGKRTVHVAIVSLLTFLSPLGATLFAPGADQAMQDLKTTNSVLPSLVVSVYVLGWAVGPLAAGPLSEVHGRYAVYTWSNMLYVVATVGCALSPTIEILTLCRFLAGCLSSTPLTIGGGTISDIVPVQKRGLALSMYMFGPVLGPCVGPLAGGFLTDTAGWRSIFWVLGVVYAFVTLIQVSVMQETYPMAILARKTRHLQKTTGNNQLRSQLDNGLSSKEVLVRTITRPLRIAVSSRVNWIIGPISAYVNGLVFLILTTAPVVFQKEYGFSPRDVGLAFFGYGMGNVLGLACFLSVSDRLVRFKAARGDKRPEVRLACAIAAAPLLALGMLWFGWAADAHTHWAVPVAGSAVVGAGNVLFFSSVVGYLVDMYTVYASSAVAANTVIRSIGGALMPLVGRSLFARLHWGWASTVLAAPPLLFFPALGYLYVKGQHLRSNDPKQLWPASTN